MSHQKRRLLFACAFAAAAAALLGACATGGPSITTQPITSNATTAAPAIALTGTPQPLTADSATAPGLPSPAIQPTLDRPGAQTATLTPAPATASASATPTFFPLTIAAMRQRSYPGSPVKIESTLDPGSNYRRYIASYQSDGLTIYGLLTVPNGTPPATGWPIIIFNHGFIPPAQYRTTQRYVAYQDWLARSGYITFKSDYRGNGSSQGIATGAYNSPDYVVDVLNAMTSLEHYPGADPNRVGMWGHSMGGYITLRAMVISHDIKAGVIWSGVVGSYTDLLEHWHRPPAQGNATPRPFNTPETGGTPGEGRGYRSLINLFGSPEANPAFWNSISATSYVSELSGPLQLHHDLADSEVPFQFSQTLYNEAVAAGQNAEFYSYPGDDHNLANSFGLAMTRTIAFFDKYVKGS